MALAEENTQIRARINGKKVVVTGGAGFIGSNLCHQLAALGAETIVLDNFLPGGGANEANLVGAKVELIRSSVRDVDLHPILAGADFLFNLAASTGHVASEQDPFADLAINAEAQLRLIQALRAIAPSAIVVHTSTRQLYGASTNLPVNESHPVVPPDSNAVSKFAGEQYWMVENRSRGRKVVSLRLTNCYGPRLCLSKGSNQGFLGHWFRAALMGVPFEVWGGDQLRDIAYVDDVVRALLLSATTPQCHGRIFNIGGSQPYSLIDLADLLCELTGKTSYVRKELPRAQASIDIGSYYAEDTAFRTASGWAPQMSVREGLKRTFEWYGSRLSSYLEETTNTGAQVRRSE